MRDSVLAARAGLWVTAHMPGAGCWWGDEWLHLLQSRRAGVHVYLLTNSKLDSAVNRRPQVQAGLSGREGLMLAYPGRLANMECLCECTRLLANIKLY